MSSYVFTALPPEDCTLHPYFDQDMWNSEMDKICIEKVVSGQEAWLKWKLTEATFLPIFKAVRHLSGIGQKQRVLVHKLIQYQRPV